MRLINPTDDQIDAAVAEYVAGWTHVHLGGNCYIWKHPRPSDGELSIYPLEKFTHSMNAVLPLLRGFWVNVEWPSEQACDVYLYEGLPELKNKRGSASDESLPRAACVALLRAHGVEVEFTEVAK